MVGVNRFQLDEEEPYEPLRVDPAIEARQARPAGPSCGPSATSAAVDAALARAEEGGRGRRSNVLYPMKDALRARATVGEVCDALREVWGTYVPTDAF